MKFPAFEPIELKNDIESFKVAELQISQIIPDKQQPRKNFSAESLEELASSIKQHGVIQPIIVKKFPDTDKYQIIAGERRWRASSIAQLKKIPAIIQESTNEKNIAISLIENIQREELNPIELAEAFYQLNNGHGLSHEAIAIMVGKSRATISNVLRLLNLSKYVRDLLVNGKLEMGHARTLLTLPSDKQILLAKKIVEKNLTVRDAEKLVQLSKSSRDKKYNPYADVAEDWVDKLTKKLSSKVTVKINEKGEGRVVIQFHSPDEVDWIVEQLAKED